jgi:nicotinamide-nucleotide amidase
VPTPLRADARRILTAELLSIGSELTVGETRDTNAGELARSLTEAGVAVQRITALPDRLEVVGDAFRAGLSRADLVVSTGGLGPTPDDLTREAIALVCGETPTVDAGLERWLRDLWARRDMPFPELNLKQAWLIPSAVQLPNPNGTAPGWFVTRPDGRVVVALPGPPREMRPMWADHALPRLRDHGLGADVASSTFRLTGIGESQVAEILGETLLRGTNPEVATYARAEAVDVRVSAIGETVRPDGGTPRTAAALVEAASAVVRERLGDYIWATGDTTWAGAIGARLAELGWRLAVAEIGTRGQLGALFGDVDWLALVESMADDDIAADPDTADAATDHDAADRLIGHARRVRDRSGAQVGLAVRARERNTDTAVSIAVVTPAGEHRETRRAFLGGSHGRTRAALAAASVLFESLRDEPR